MKNADNLINKMKVQNLKPIPKWQFVLKGGLIWFILSASIILGGLAFSIILFSIQQLDFNLISHMSHSRIEFLLGILPFLWIALLIVFLIFGIISIRNSKRGYKFTPARLFIINSALSILMGTLFFIGGGAQWLENAFAVNLEFYESINDKKVKMWTLPEEGYLSGSILRITDNKIILKDFNNTEWEIDFSNANIPVSIDLVEGKKIKIVGKLISPNRFYADKIKPWGGDARQKREKQ